MLYVPSITSSAGHIVDHHGRGPRRTWADQSLLTWSVPRTAPLSAATYLPHVPPMAATVGYAISAAVRTLPGACHSLRLRSLVLTATPHTSPFAAASQSLLTLPDHSFSNWLRSLSTAAAPTRYSLIHPI